MKTWIFIVLLFAIAGLVLSLIKGSPMELVLLKDIILLLITLGMLLHLRSETKKGKKE
ncbi:MAG: hypothetical protein KAS65_00320 [Candidatus Aminicenantes bacterium]|nr:hypothetical protein [Candidatus Aminicenantes bacterium]